MILETRCNRCGKHIGYVSMTDLPGIKSKFVKTIEKRGHISGDYVQIELMCDSCRDGIIDLAKETSQSFCRSSQ